MAMRTLSKLLLLTLLAPGCAMAATSGEIFAQAKAEILATAYVKKGGYRFGVARVRPTTFAGIRGRRAPTQAWLYASTDLMAAIACEAIAWSDALPPETCRALERILCGRLGLSATVSGLTTVHSAREGDCWVCVVALPESEAAKVPRLTFEEARARLLREEVLLAEGAPVEALIALRRTAGPMPEAIDRAPWEGLLAAAAFATPRLKALPRLAGRYPLGSAELPTDGEFAKGSEAFGRGDLPAAYAAFLRLPGHEAEAAALLLHAAYLKPTSPFPGSISPSWRFMRAMPPWPNGAAPRQRPSAPTTLGCAPKSRTCAPNPSRRRCFGRLGAPPPRPPAGCKAPCTPGRVLRTRLKGRRRGGKEPERPEGREGPEGPPRWRDRHPNESQRPSLPASAADPPRVSR